MATAPFGVRLLVGAAATALEETRKLPQTVAMYPMTVVSQVAQLVMRLQQDVAGLIIKGDETLERFFPPKDEQPAWATFDEDGPDALTAPDVAASLAGDTGVDDTGVDAGTTGPSARPQGRYALYSDAPNGDALYSGGEPPARTVERRAAATAEVPDLVADLGYETLTLAQLRARLTQLKQADLEVLLAFEGATKARAPFQTLLSNRITRVSAR